MTSAQPILSEMNERTREVFRRVVEGYLSSGEPVGSRTLTRTLSERVSAATVRNVMQDLEYLGLLDSPHVSAGRVPTQAGLRMFVDSLLEVGTVSPEDQEWIDATLGVNDHDVPTLLDEVGAALSVITRGASVVLAPKHEAAIRHIEFVSLSVDRVLAVHPAGGARRRQARRPLGRQREDRVRAARMSTDTSVEHIGLQHVTLTKADAHLESLVDEAITIIREVATECENPVLLFSGGKDSAVLLHLALLAFAPARLPKVRRARQTSAGVRIPMVTSRPS